MGSNVIVADDELLEINNAIYGSPRLAMATPIVTQIAGQERNYSDGGLKNEQRKKIIYDLVQRFPESEIAKLFSSTATEKAQAHVASDVFNYIRKALLVEIEYSNLDATVDKVQPQARMIMELLKQYDLASYSGFFGNFGVQNNPKLKDAGTQAGTTLSEIIAAVRLGLTNFEDIGWKEENMAEVTIGMTPTVSRKLSAVGTNRSQSDKKIFAEEFEGANMITLPDYLNRGDRIEIYLRPLITHHHASLPSLYKDYNSLDDMTNYNLFSFETSALEVEEQGAITTIPLTLT